MKTVLAIVAATLLYAGQASGSGVNHAFCINFERGSMTNTCSRDLDVTWCHSDSTSRCTDRWKSDYARAGGRTTVDFDADDEDRLFSLVYACDKDDGECLKARNDFRQNKSR